MANIGFIFVLDKILKHKPYIQKKVFYEIKQKLEFVIWLICLKIWLTDASTTDMIYVLFTDQLCLRDLNKSTILYQQYRKKKLGEGNKREREVYRT